MNELWNVCIEWNVFCQFTIVSCHQTDLIVFVPSLKMSSESYSCYLVCCSFDSLLEQPVNCSLLEQSVYWVYSASQLKLPVKPVQSVVCGESLTLLWCCTQPLYPDMFFNKDCATHKPRLCGIGGSYMTSYRYMHKLQGKSEAHLYM